MGCGLRLSGCVVFVRELAVNVNHLCASKDIELLLGSTCSTLNDSHACTLWQCDLDSILTANWAGEDRGEFFLHDPDDTSTSTTHANPAARMGDLPLISTFHASFAKRSSKGYQGQRTNVPGIRNCIPYKGSQNGHRTTSIAHRLVPCQAQRGQACEDDIAEQSPVRGPVLLIGYRCPVAHKPTILCRWRSKIPSKAGKQRRIQSISRSGPSERHQVHLHCFPPRLLWAV